MLDVGEKAFELIISLLMDVIKENTGLSELNFLEKRRIERRVEESTTEVISPLLPFLTHEGLPEEKQARLIETCVTELRPFTNQPERLFQGSLDGQKIFDELYAARPLPEVVVEDGTKDLYALVCPRIATLLCKVPATVKDWESQAWTENYRRFDELNSQLRALFSLVDSLASIPAKEADKTLTLARQSLAQKIRLEMDITGLRADQPTTGKFDEFFIHPQISQIKHDSAKLIIRRKPVGTTERSFEEFSHSGSIAIIIGSPGSGKSTWTKWLQREALTPRWTGLAIRVELRSVSSQSLPTLQSLVREAVGIHLAEELSVDRIRTWLDAAQIIFILDGFDELSLEIRDQVYAWLIELRSAAQKCPFILTSRPLTTPHLDELSKSWRDWMIEPFDRNRIVEYIHRWYTCTPLLPEDSRTIDAATLADEWLGDPTIEPLTGNPLLLSTLLMVHHLDGRLPSGRSQLYRRYVDGMLGVWDDRRHIVSSNVHLNPDQKRALLRSLALFMFLSEKEQLDEPDALEWLNVYLVDHQITDSPDQVLGMLRERTGLIIGPGLYSFVHKSVAEYLVAEAVLQGDQRDANGQRIDRFYLFEKREDDRWNTVTFLWAGLAPLVDLEEFIRICLNTDTLALGFGLIFDQYVRFDRTERRQLLLSTNSFDDSDFHRRALIGGGGPYNGLMIPLPSLTLSGIKSGYLDIQRLYRIAIRDGTILPDDVEVVREDLYVLLWALFAIRRGFVISNSDWEKILTLPVPTKTSRIDWLLMIAQHAIQTEDDIRTFQNVFPQDGGILTLGLISRLRMQEDFWIREIEKNKENYDLLNDLIIQYHDTIQWLSRGNIGPISNDYLMGTEFWNNFNHKIPTFDLLSYFIESIKNMIEAGGLQQDDDVVRAIAYVRGLIEQREKLIAEMPPAPKRKRKKAGTTKAD